MLMNFMNEIKNRELPGIVVTEEVYIGGLLDIVGFLCSELVQFLIEENRYFGISKSYIKSINDALSKITDNVPPEEVDFYGRILFLLKPIIMKEFNKLRSRSISSGDSIIIIIKKILEIVSGREYRNNREVRTLRKIINKFFDNIRHRRKNDSMYNFSNIIKTCMEKGIVGKFTLDHLTFKSKTSEKEELIGSGIRINEESGKIKEVTWKEE